MRANRPASSLSAHSLISAQSVLPSMASTTKNGEVITDVIEVSIPAVDETDEEEPQVIPAEGKESTNRYFVVFILLIFYCILKPKVLAQNCHDIISA